LTYTLNSSVENTRTFDHLPNGYGSYTRTFLICVDKDVNALSADIQSALRKMSRLQTFEIRVSVALPGAIPVHFLSTARLSGDGVALILDQGMAQALSHFQRLVVVPDCRLCSPVPDISQMAHRTLLPNLQDIDLWEGPISPPELLPLFTEWMIPRLKSLSFVYYSFSPERRRAFIGLFETQGLSLWYLKVEVKNNDALPLSDILELCSSLRSFVVVCSCSARLYYLPTHPNLEVLDIQERWSRGEDFGEPYLDQFDEFTSSWRVRFPNLRVAKFKGVALGFRGCYVVHLEMVFRTEDSVYIVNDGQATYKRWQGSWIGEGTRLVSIEN